MSENTAATLYQFIAYTTLPKTSDVTAARFTVRLRKPTGFKPLLKTSRNL
jgi:hypothetical protein